MIADISTGTKAEPIPLTEKNMISRSFELNEPAICSRNKEYHYSTINNGLEKGVYDDYVSYCFLKTNDKKKPLYSLSIDCKGEEQVRKLKALVDSQFFSVICSALEVKYNKEAEKQIK